MAVYVVSIQGLALRATKRASERTRWAGSPNATPTIATEREARQATRQPTKESPATAEKSDGDSDSLGPEVEGLVGSSRERIEALCSQLDESGGKAFLMLVHRLASVETQLAKLQSRVAGDSSRTRIPTRNQTKNQVPEEPWASHSASKLDVLEEVYRKNLELRRTD